MALLHGNSRVSVQLLKRMIGVTTAITRCNIQSPAAITFTCSSYALV